MAVLMRGPYIRRIIGAAHASPHHMLGFPLLPALRTDFAAADMAVEIDALLIFAPPVVEAIDAVRAHADSDGVLSPSPDVDLDFGLAGDVVG